MEDNIPAKKIHLQYYLVIFLDLLGQRASLRKINKELPTNETEKTKFISEIKESYGKVLQTRDLFKRYFDQFSDDNVPYSKRIKIHYYGISDSIIIAVPLGDIAKNNNRLTGTFSAMQVACSTILLSLCNNTPIRGGLDVGIAALIGDDEIYGPALERALFLENELAEYPRLIVGDELLGDLSMAEQQGASTTSVMRSQKYAELCKQMIIKDTDGRKMLDFLGPSIKELFIKSTTSAVNSTLSAEEIFRGARDFVERSYNGFVAKNDHKLASRYYRLLHYFNSRSDLWSNPPDKP